MIALLLSFLLYGPVLPDCPNAYEAGIKQRVYTYVDEWPQFPGGDAAISKHIMDNLKYPKDVDSPQGSFSLQFIVQANGELAHVIIPGKSPEKYTKLDKEVIRILKIMPRWKPGRCKGIAVPVKMPFRIACIMPQE
jgi:protein TonB